MLALQVMFAGIDCWKVDGTCRQNEETWPYPRIVIYHTHSSSLKMEYFGKKSKTDLVRITCKPKNSSCRGYRKGLKGKYRVVVWVSCLMLTVSRQLDLVCMFFLVAGESCTYCFVSIFICVFCGATGGCSD